MGALYAQPNVSFIYEPEVQFGLESFGPEVFWARAHGREEVPESFAN
jgi:hypothetical protein